MDFETADALNRAIRLIGMKHRGQATVALSRLGLHTGQEVLLLELDARGPRTQAELAGALGCEPPSVTLMVQKLEAAGLIERRPSATDGRATVVELTDGGRALMPRLREVWLRLAEATVARLSGASLDSVLEVVEDLASSLYARRPERVRPRARRR
ncbi:MAG TPA: MarR family transcriptional regulator [Candidatus Dormibacteraeota bacterium]|nr:MarR family transcriptional regulator [Candidatus Dormibacteraeota bacterium]